MLLIGSVWGLVVIAGMWALVLYQDTPGRAAEPSTQWPSKSGIVRASDRATLILVAHPKCPCTRASIGELNSLMVEGKGKVNVYVLFYKPKSSADGWEKTDLWYSAASIPGVQVRSDEGGREARLFHASTSGQTILFDRSGHIVFRGGITAGRGHAGENAGSSAIVSFLRTGQAERKKTPVFGCSITGEG